MEADTRNGLEYCLSVDQTLRDVVFGLRKWNHLRMATEHDLIWIRGFSENEIESIQVLSLPSVNRYYLKEAKLYAYGGRLPSRIEPSLLWTPIERALKLSLPKQNFNFFGLEQNHDISIVPSELERQIDATMIPIETLQTYVNTAPRIRMAHLKWCLINSKYALIIGMPLLPVKSDDFYLNKCFLIPGGWKLKYENMINVYKKALPDNTDYWYLIDTTNKICKIRKSDFSFLNKGSVRQTIDALIKIKELLEFDE